MADASIFTTHCFLRTRRPLFHEALPPPPGRVSSGPRGHRRSARLRALVRSSTLYSDEEFSDEEHEVGRVDGDEGGDARRSRRSDSRRWSFTSLVSWSPSGASQGSGAAATPSEMLTGDLAAAARGSLPMRNSLPDGRGESASVDSVNKLEADGQPGAAPPPRRHRGQSRCDSQIATVDADMDSLGSSEESEQTPSAAAGVSFKESATDVSHREFPVDTDVSDEAKYMRRVQQAAEEWMYDIVYQRNYWITIPYGITELYRTGLNSQRVTKANENGAEKKKKRGAQQSCPFHMESAHGLLLNLIGPSATKYMRKYLGETSKIYEEWSYEGEDLIIPGNTNEDPTGTILSSEVIDPPLHNLVVAKLRQYAVILQMMRGNGAVLPHVRPEDLLDYNAYKELVIGTSTPQNTTQTRKLNFEVPWDSVADSTSASERETYVRPIDRGDFLSRPLRSRQLQRQISRQAWLDVILQMARTFWMPKIDEEHTRSQEAIITGDASSAARKAADLRFRSRQYSVASAANYSEQVLCLMAWLNERYTHARETVCKDMSAPPPQRTITNFDNDLADGVVFAYVTLDICPYVKEFMRDIYSTPTTLEQAVHNAARVVKVWRMQHLAFTVSVRDVVQPVAVKMVLLVAFLYNVLPALAGREVLHLSASLVNRTVLPLTLVNPSRNRLEYLAEFIGDTGSFFSVLGGTPTPDKPGFDTSAVAITLPPNQRLNLNIRFHARSFNARRCTLLLSGVVQASQFARSLALRLEGRPSALDVSATVNLCAPLYRPKNHTLSLPMPYDSCVSNFSASDMELPEFDLYLSNSLPSVDRPFADCAWSEQRRHKELRRLFLNQNTVTVTPPAGGLLLPSPPLRGRKGAAQQSRPQNKKSSLSLSVTTCALTPSLRTFWIGCVNPNVGDFIIKVVTRPMPAPPLGTLVFDLPSGWKQASCTCGGRFFGDGAFATCPLTTKVEVPCSNTALVRAATTMFKKTLDNCDLGFWKEHLESDIGLQLMQLDLVKDKNVIDEYAHIFNNSVVYSVSFTPATLNAPVELTIPDVHKRGTVPLPLHVDNDTSSRRAWKLRLTSADGRELRLYRLLPQPPPGYEEPEDTAGELTAALSSTRSDSGRGRVKLGSSRMPQSSIPTRSQTNISRTNSTHQSDQIRQTNLRYTRTTLTSQVSSVKSKQVNEKASVARNRL